MLPSLQAPEEDHGVARGWDCGLPVIGGCWGWAGKYTVGKWLETLQVTSCRGLKISSFGSQGRWVHCCWAPYLSFPAKEPALSCSQQKHQQDVVAPGGKVNLGSSRGSLSPRLEAGGGVLWEQQKWTCEKLAGHPEMKLFQGVDD